jgi:hypothetical protein
MKNIVIIGAGIAGLYTGYRLLQKNKYLVTIIEKEKELGGRLFTQKVDIDKKTFHLEGGAGVLRDDDENIVSLLKELKIPFNLWKSNTDVIYNTNNKNILLNEDYSHPIEELCTQSKNNISFIDLLNNNNNLDKLDKIGILIGSTYTELFNANSKNICENNDFFEFLYTNSHKFGKPESWAHVAEVLGKIIIDLGGSIINNTSVKEINEKSVITNRKKEYLYDKLIITCPYHYFSKIIVNNKFDKWKQLIDSYHDEIDYLRIYSYFKEPIIIKNKIASNLSIRRVIPLSDRMIMTVYTDGKDATLINKLSKSNDDLNQFLKEQLKLLLEKEIPDIEKNWCFFWKKGISYWKPSNMPMNDLINEIIHPIDNVFFCGDTYSEFPGWIESALKSSEKIIKYF